MRGFVLGVLEPGAVQLVYRMALFDLEHKVVTIWWQISYNRQQY